jgi:hypothetical protein
MTQTKTLGILLLIAVVVIATIGIGTTEQKQMAKRLSEPFEYDDEGDELSD